MFDTIGFKIILIIYNGKSYYMYEMYYFFIFVYFIFGRYEKLVF